MIQIKAGYDGEMSTKEAICLTEICDLHHYLSL